MEVSLSCGSNRLPCCSEDFHCPSSRVLDFIRLKLAQLGLIGPHQPKFAVNMMPGAKTLFHQVWTKGRTTFFCRFDIFSVRVSPCMTFLSFLLWVHPGSVGIVSLWSQPGKYDMTNSLSSMCANLAGALQCTNEELIQYSSIFFKCINLQSDENTNNHQFSLTNH